MALAFPNRFDGATLSGQGWTSTLPVSNPGTRQLSQVARSQFAVSKFYANFTAAIESRLFGIVGHNLSTSGKVRVRGYSADPRPPLDKLTSVSVTDVDLADGFPASSISTSRAGSGTYFDAAGLLQSAGTNVPRFTHDITTLKPLGLMAEAASTNRLLWCRDLTKAAWTKTNATVALTVTGIDGAANSASRITANAANATVNQTIAGGNHICSVFARRVTGSGTVQVGDGTTMSSMTLTTAWKRFWVVTGTGGTIFSIKLVTSGDVIEVDYCQNEAVTPGMAAVTSPILTTTATATRVTESHTIALPAGARPDNLSGTWVAAVRVFGSPVAGNIDVLTAGNLRLTYTTSVTLQAQYVSTATAATGTLADGSDHIIAARYANAAHTCYADGSVRGSLANPATSAGAITSITVSPGDCAFVLGRLCLFSEGLDNTTLGTVSTAFTAPTAGYDSGQVDAWHADWVSGTTAEQRSGARGVALVDAGSVQSYQYWRTDLIDPTNTAGYVQLGRVFMGSSWAPDHGMLTGASIGYESRSVTTEADDGAEYHDEKRSPLVVRFNLEAQTQNEAMLKILEMQRTLGTTGELLFIWDSADTLYAPYRTFLGRLRSLTPITAINSNLWSAAFEVKEAL